MCFGDAGTSSIAAAICYAWLLENRMSNNRNKGEGDGEGCVVMPMINVMRGRMWKQGRLLGCFTMLVLMQPHWSLPLVFVNLKSHLEIIDKVALLQCYIFIKLLTYTC